MNDTDFKNRLIQAIKDGDLTRGTVEEVLDTLNMDTDGLPGAYTFRLEVSLTIPVYELEGGNVPDSVKRRVVYRIEQLINGDNSAIFEEVDAVDVDINDIEDADQ